MKTIQLSHFGGPDALEIVEAPMPVPGPGQVLIRAHAMGINYFETLMLDDRYAISPQLPAHLGVEVAGTVEMIGTNITTISIGERVAVALFATNRPFGGYSEYVSIDAESIVSLPDELDFDSAVALLVQGLTALHLVRRSDSDGKSVLITAAAGGVGSLLIQMARRAGAYTVIAAASSPAKLELAYSLGADVGIDYSQPDWFKQVKEHTKGIGVDIVYDFVGGTITQTALAALAPGGELFFGALGRFELEKANVEKAFAENQSLRGFGLLPLLNPADLKSDIQELFSLAISGELRVTIGARFPLENAADAHHLLGNRKTIGKIILTS